MGVLCVVHGLCGVLSTGCGVVWWVAVPCGLCGGWVFFVMCGKRVYFVLYMDCVVWWVGVPCVVQGGLVYFGLSCVCGLCGVVGWCTLCGVCVLWCYM